MFTTKNLLMLAGRQMLIAAGAVVIAIIAITFIASMINSLTGTIVKNRMAVTTLEKHTELLTTLKHDSEIIGTNDVLIEGAFPPANDIQGFTSALENLALSNGVTQALSFGAPATSAVVAPFPIYVVPYSNSVTGNITLFINYLKGYEGLPYFTKISSLSISSVGRWGESATMSFSATLQTKLPQ